MMGGDGPRSGQKGCLTDLLPAGEVSFLGHNCFPNAFAWEGVIDDTQEAVAA